MILHSPLSGRAAFVLAALLLVSCGNDTPATPPPDAGGSPGASSHLLAHDLPDAVTVSTALLTDPETEVTVVGRVRYVAKGTFALVDHERFEYCGQTKDDGCRTPWDYCCEDQEEVSASTLVVEALDPDGVPVPKQELGLRALDLVAVRGRLEQDEDGVLVLRAKNGWFRRERPQVGAHARFDD